jgi:hypothetical protein
MADSKIKPCAWVTKADVRDFYTGPGESVFLFERSGKWNFPLIPLSEAQRLEAEVQRLKAVCGQASFALRSLVPDDPDAQFTVAMIDAAIKGEKE